MSTARGFRLELCAVTREILRFAQDDSLYFCISTSDVTRLAREELEPGGLAPESQVR